MKQMRWAYVLLAAAIGVLGCSSDSDDGPGGSGGSAGAGGAAGTGGVAGTGGAAGTGGGAGTGGAAGTGGTGGTTSCDSSGTTAFSFAGVGSEPDCVVPGVCFARNRAKGIYNAATELAPDNAVSPEGTLWAPSTCANANPPDDFTTFVALLQSFGGGLGGANDRLLGESLCLWLTNENLFYDVVFSAWGAVESSDFAYTRTAAGPDECGVAGATCGATCGCPEGFVNRDGDGICVVPDPCDASPCGAGALCRRTGARSHRCECDTVEFTRPPGQPDVVDCINSDVCLARLGLDGTEEEIGAIYNSLQEDASAPRGVCGQPNDSRPAIPTFTEWSRLPCASSGPSSFHKFFDNAYACGGKVPNRIVGLESCLRTTTDNVLWSIQFTDWCVTNLEGVGCFSYVRWQEVDDGEACP